MKGNQNNQGIKVQGTESKLKIEKEQRQERKKKHQSYILKQYIVWCIILGN